MSTLNRRSLIMGAASVPLLSACGNGLGSNAADRIDARVDSAIQFMYDNIPGTRDLMSDAEGVLIMPLITEAAKSTLKSNATCLTATSSGRAKL